jgi:hypothetical protein
MLCEHVGRNQRFFETTVSAYTSTQRHKPEGKHASMSRLVKRCNIDMSVFKAKESKDGRINEETSRLLLPAV